MKAIVLTQIVAHLFGMWGFALAPLSAALVVHEPFDYPTGNLSGNGGAMGTTGVWVVSGGGDHQITSGNVVYGSPEAVPTEGNQLALGGTNTTQASISLGLNLTNAGLLDDGSEMWFSILVDAGQTAGNNDSFLFGFSDGGVLNSSDGSFGAGASGFSILHERNKRLNLSTTEDGSASRTTVTANVIGGSGARLIVGRVTWASNSAGADQIDLFLPGNDLEQGSVVRTTTRVINQAGIDTLHFGRQGSLGDSIDEIRVGGSYEDVVGIPEPSSILLTSIGLLAILRRRR